MTPDDLIKATDLVSRQSDRWLFVALLIIGLVVVWILYRYFTGEIARLRKRLDDVNDRFESHLKDENKEMITVIQQSTDVIRQNSEILDDLRKFLIARA